MCAIINMMLMVQKKSDLYHAWLLSNGFYTVIVFNLLGLKKLVDVYVF